MNKKELEKIEMKNDGKDQERFKTLLKQVVNVPKKELKKREQDYKDRKQKA
ncbi:MAG: hypothetical protein IPL32_13710 [Chloracidobacterium sp.]|nr:hypothetical protein [Chloracidobacterium sp.]